MSFDTKVWITIVVSVVVTAAIRGSGPAAVGTRPPGIRITRVLALLPAALMAALVVTETVVQDGHLKIDARLGGVVAGALVAWRRVSVIWVILTAAVVTALLRLIF